MASSDSVFLFELAVEKLKSFIPAGNYRIRVKFGDVFFIKLRDPNELYAEAAVSRKRSKRLNVRGGKSMTVVSTRSVLVASDVDTLVTNMMRFPIEVTVFSRDDPYTLGIVQIPWDAAQIEYVKNLKTNNELPPLILRDQHKLFDEYSSKRVATITLKLQLSRLNDSNSQIRPKHSIGTRLTEYSEGNLNPEFTKALTTRRDFKIDYELDTGLIKTIYSGGKRKKKSGLSKNKHKKVHEENTHSDPHSTADEIIEESQEIEKVIEDEQKQAIEADKDDKESVLGLDNHASNDISTISLAKNTKTKESIASLIRSQTNLEIETSNKCLLGVTKHWSTTSLEIKERLDTLNYIFGNLDGPFGRQVYCVGYFTVENDMGFSADPPKNDKSLNSPNTGTPNTGTGTPNPVTESSGIGTPTNLGADSSRSGKESPKVEKVESPKVEKVESPKEKPQAKPPKAGTVSAAPVKAGPVATKSDGVLRGSGKYSFKVCGEQCKMQNDNKCFENICSLDLPEEAAHLITMRKCTEVVECVHKRRSSTEPSSDEHIVMDFTNLRPEDCCVKLEQVVGGVTAQLQPSIDPCFCTCECTFGFVRKTTYCNVCGGYEVAGDEMVGKRGEDPFPCPIYHKLTEKGKKGLGPSSSGGDARKKTALPGLSAEGEAVTGTAPARTKGKPISPGEKRSLTLDRKSNESDKETTKKTKKCKKDDRFKFNYGYKAPQIGHSECAMPCTGHLHPVPKHMGWLWNAKDIPGLKPQPLGWRPGAISKRLLAKLNKAKRSHYNEPVPKPLRRAKKRTEDKPTLIVAKRNGEYVIEMQVYDENENIDHCKPVIYKIESADNKEKVARKERRAQRLIKQQWKKIWKDPFHPEVCEKICMPVYKQALGLPPYSDNPDCICPEDAKDSASDCDDIEDDISDSSSLDLDWELHFTPPIANN